MENEVQTHTDYEWHGRINSLVNKLLYRATNPDIIIDPSTTDRFELEAAKQIIRWELEQK